MLRLWCVPFTKSVLPSSLNSSRIWTGFSNQQSLSSHHEFGGDCANLDQLRSPLTSLWMVFVWDCWKIVWHTLSPFFLILPFTILPIFLSHQMHPRSSSLYTKHGVSFWNVVEDFFACCFLKYPLGLDPFYQPHTLSNHWESSCPLHIVAPDMIWKTILIVSFLINLLLCTLTRSLL